MRNVDVLVGDLETTNMLDIAESLLSAANRPLEAKVFLQEVLLQAGGDPGDAQSLVGLNTAITLDNRFVPARILGKAVPHPMPAGTWQPSYATRPFKPDTEPSKYRQAGQEFHPAWALKRWNLKRDFTEIDDEADVDAEVQAPKKIRRVSKKKDGNAA